MLLLVLYCIVTIRESEYVCVWVGVLMIVFLNWF